MPRNYDAEVVSAEMVILGSTLDLVKEKSKLWINEIRGNILEESPSHIYATHEKNDAVQ